MLSIQNYGSSSEDEGDDNTEDAKQHSNESLLTHLKPVDPELSVGKKIQICAAPIVMPTVRFKFVFIFVTSKYFFHYFLSNSKAGCICDILLRP